MFLKKSLFLQNHVTHLSSSSLASQALGVKSSLKQAMSTILAPSMRSTWPRKLLLMLWVKSGRTALSKSVGPKELAESKSFSISKEDD
ncbi:hypothetical protein LEMLEM_LOCUS6998, partial [Lemmus lemmus]